MFVLPMLCPTHMYLIKSQILQTPSLQENHLILLALACHVILIYCSIFPGLGADGNCFSGLLLWRSDFMHKPRDRLYMYWLQNEITASFSTLIISLPHHPKSFFVSHLDTMLSHWRKRCAPFTVHPTLKNYKSMFYIDLILVQLSTNDSAVFFQGQVASSCQFQLEFFFLQLWKPSWLNPSFLRLF